MPKKHFTPSHINGYPLQQMHNCHSFTALSLLPSCPRVLVRDVSCHFEVGEVVLSPLGLHSRPHHAKSAHTKRENSEGAACSMLNIPAQSSTLHCRRKPNSQLLSVVTFPSQCTEQAKVCTTDKAASIRSEVFKTQSSIKKTGDKRA